MRINVAACKIACPHAYIGSFDFISNGLAINWRRLINDSVRPLCVWICATGCSTLIPIDMQYSLKLFDVNSLALSKRIVLIGLSRNWALNLIIWANSHANATLRVDSKEMCDHLVHASIKTIKYLNGPLGGWIGPHISPCMRSRKARDWCPILANDGRTISFPWEHAMHGKSFD